MTCINAFAPWLRVARLQPFDGAVCPFIDAAYGVILGNIAR